MTAKEYLNQIRTLDVIIKQKRQEVDELHDIAIAIGSFDYSKDRVQTSPKGEAPYAKTAEKAVELDEEISDLVGRKYEILNHIQGMDDLRYIEVLYKRYVEYKPFDIIAKEMNYNYDYVRQIHGEALKVFETSHKNSHRAVI